MVERRGRRRPGQRRRRGRRRPGVDQVLICTPDKDLGQCVAGRRVVQLDRRKAVVYDEDGVEAKFGVAPASIPDYLALVGDSADGFPGLPGWGAKSAAAVLARWGTIEAIPPERRRLGGHVRGAPSLAATLRDQRDWPCCSRTWPRSGSTGRYSRRRRAALDRADRCVRRVCARLDAGSLYKRVDALATERAC